MILTLFRGRRDGRPAQSPGRGTPRRTGRRVPSRISSTASPRISTSSSSSTRSAVAAADPRFTDSIRDAARALVAPSRASVRERAELIRGLARGRPLGEVVALALGLDEQDPGAPDRGVDPRGPHLPVVRPPGAAAPERDHQADQRRRQAHGQPPPLPLLGRPAPGPRPVPAPPRAIAPERRWCTPSPAGLPCRRLGAGRMGRGAMQSREPGGTIPRRRRQASSRARASANSAARGLVPDLVPRGALEYGGQPVRISQRIAPRPKTSARSSTCDRPRPAPARGPCRRASPGRCRPGIRSPNPCRPRRPDPLSRPRAGRPLALVGHAPFGEDLGQAPVHHLDLAEGAHHHVGRLEVAVDHAAGVGVGDRLADLLEDRQEPRDVEGRVGALGQQRGQGPASDQLHRQERPAVGERARARRPARSSGCWSMAADLRLLDEPIAEVDLSSRWGRSRTFRASSRPRSASRARSTAPMPPRAISPRIW